MHLSSGNSDKRSLSRVGRLSAPTPTRVQAAAFRKTQASLSDASVTVNARRIKAPIDCFTWTRGRRRWRSAVGVSAFPLDPKSCSSAPRRCRVIQRMWPISSEQTLSQTSIAFTAAKSQLH